MVGNQSLSVFFFFVTIENYTIELVSVNISSYLTTFESTHKKVRLLRKDKKN